MKNITITTDEYDKLKADKKAAEIIIAQMTGALEAFAEHVGYTPETMNKLVAEGYQFLGITK